MTTYRLRFSCLVPQARHRQHLQRAQALHQISRASATQEFLFLQGFHEWRTGSCQPASNTLAHLACDSQALIDIMKLKTKKRNDADVTLRNRTRARLPRHHSMNEDQDESHLLRATVLRLLSGLLFSDRQAIGLPGEEAGASAL